MKRFTPEASKTRMMSNLRVNEDWSMLVNNGTISNLLDVVAEGKNELARYMEYLYLEKFWKTSQNFTSKLAQGKLIGYKRRLPVSAIGTVVVSHSDINGNNRLMNLGSLFFDINSKSDFDDRERNVNANTIEKSSLVPWLSDSQYMVPKGTRFIANNGVEFISTKSVSSKPLLEKWSDLQGNDAAYKAFLKNGGWNGIKYLKIPVIQGKRMSVSLGICNNTRFQTFIYNATNVEDASNSVSREFFSIVISYKGKSEVWTEVESLTIAEEYDKVFEKKILDDESGVQIKFGDGITGKIPPEGALVTMNFLETLGSLGNIEQKYQLTSIVPENPIIDPRTRTYSNNFLACTNIYPIAGGRDIESKEDYTIDAPKSYLRNFTISGLDSYKSFIDRYSPINFLHYRVYNDRTIKTNTVNTLGASTLTTTGELKYLDNDSVKDEITTVFNDIHITGVLPNGTVLEEDDSEDSLIKPLEYALAHKMSPNDRLVYTKPNVVKINCNIIINSTDLTTTEDDISDQVQNAIKNEYDIYNQTFKEPLFYSKIVDLAKSFKFSDSVRVITEAQAAVDTSAENIILQTKGINETPTTLLSIPFKFDRIFLENQYYRGFKDCTVNSDYLIKVNIKFKNVTNANVKSRTLFLIDNRIDETYNISLEKAKDLWIDDRDTKLEQCGEYSAGTDTFKLFKETENDFKYRQVRTAQFPYINKVTDNIYMSDLRDFNTYPSEIRPYIQDNTGINKFFKKDDVLAELRSSEADPCCKKNTQYYDGMDIAFVENYTDENNSVYGYVTVPLNFFGFYGYENLSSLTSGGATTNDYETISNYLTQFVDIEVLAQPKTEDLFPLYDNDIICVDKVITEKRKLN